jgi:hypothetical protein
MNKIAMLLCILLSTAALAGDGTVGGGGQNGVRLNGVRTQGTRMQGARLNDQASSGTGLQAKNAAARNGKLFIRAK